MSDHVVIGGSYRSVKIYLRVYIQDSDYTIVSWRRSTTVDHLSFRTRRGNRVIPQGKVPILTRSPGTLGGFGR
jgi:hypothetical protein